MTLINIFNEAEKAEDNRRKELLITTGVPFAAGDEVCWLHGNCMSNRSHYRVAKVLEINFKERKVHLSGMTSNYWTDLDKLLLRLDVVPYSHG